MLNKLRARYERRNPIALVGMGLADLVCWIVVRLVPLASRELTPQRFNKVLLVNPAHIGDVVISTAAVRRLKEHNPNVSIGFVVGSWARLVLEDHPGVDNLYVVDHWKLNRSDAGVFKKLFRYFMTWWDVRLQLVKERYDLAILLNGYAPNLSSLLWASHIPVRVGYVSAGNTSLLNIVLKKSDSAEPEQSIQLQLLDRLGIAGGAAGWLNTMPLGQRRRTEIGLNDRYFVLHPGTGNVLRSWPAERWVSLAQELCASGIYVAVTGHGQTEYKLAERISKETGAANLVDRLSWCEWKSVLSNASVVIGVESAAGHVCAALGVKFVGIYSGMAVISRWSPTSDKNIILTQRMPCSPCHTRPCGERTCITAVTPADVHKAALRLLSSGRDSAF